MLKKVGCVLSRFATSLRLSEEVLSDRPAGSWSSSKISSVQLSQRLFGQPDLWQVVPKCLRWLRSAGMAEPAEPLLFPYWLRRFVKPGRLWALTFTTWTWELWFEHMAIIHRRGLEFIHDRDFGFGEMVRWIGGGQGAAPISCVAHHIPRRGREMARIRAVGRVGERWRRECRALSI